MKLFWIFPVSVFSCVLFFLSSCGDDEKDDNPFMKHHDRVETTTTISTDFNSNTFSSDAEIALLKELKLCDPNATSDTNELHPSCSPRFFRFFPLSDKIPLKDGFILLIKAGVNGTPLRRILIFQRENGELIKLNGFFGNLIEQRPSKTGYNDLVIRFTDNIEGSLAYYNCLFQWNNGQYAYTLCEAIQEGGQEAPHRIKAEYIDSMAPEIKSILDRNHMIY